MGDEGLVETFSGVNTLFIVSPTAEDRIRLVNSTADSAKKAGVKHIVVVSVEMADLPQLILGKHFFEIEKHISTLGVPYTFVRLPFFLENLFCFISSQNAIYCSVNPDIQFGSIAVEDAGNAVAAILVNPAQYLNSTMSLFSDFHSCNDIVRELSSALGRDVSYVHTSMKVMEKNLKDMGVPE